MSHASPQVAIFAATGAISRGVARAFAEQGATLWLAGRDERVDTFADELRDATGGSVRVGHVDATRPDQVGGFLDRIVAETGHIDVVFNGIGGPPTELRYPAPSVELSVEDFLVPLERIVGSQFLTAREAGARMAQHGSGSIVLLSATLSGMTAPNMAGISATCGAVEAMTRALAGDFGPRGVRVNCVRGSAMPETRTIRQTSAGQAAILGGPMPISPPPIGRPVTVADTAAAAAFLGSPAAGGIHGQVLTVCGGQFVGQG